MLDDERIWLSSNISFDLGCYFYGAYQTSTSRSSVIVNHCVFVRVSGNENCFSLNVHSDQQYFYVGNMGIIAKYYAVNFLIDFIF